MATYLIDIDGTIANAKHRVWVLEEKRPYTNWDLFFSLAVDDPPFPHMQQLLADLAVEDDCGHPQSQIIYVSGRPERCRQLTVKWLSQHSFPTPTQYFDNVLLYMRKDGDHRPDYIVKKELLDQLRADGHEPTMAFDDRDCVVKMWRENGVPCAQVAEGRF